MFHCLTLVAHKMLHSTVFWKINKSKLSCQQAYL